MPVPGPEPAPYNQPVGGALKLAAALVVGAVLLASAAWPAAPPDNSGPRLTDAPDVARALTHDPELPDDKQLRDTLRQILAQDRYKVDPLEEADTRWIDRIIQWLTNLLSRITGSGIGTPVYYVGLVLVCLLAALIVYALVRFIWVWYSARDRKAPDDSKDVEQSYTTSDWIEAARQAWKRGDFRNAIRYRFKAVLSIVELPRTATLTNFQIARQVGREHPDLRSPFEELVRRFEDAWYGSMTTEAGDYDRVSVLAVAIEGVLTAEENK
jgi:hypothetical protein